MASGDGASGPAFAALLRERLIEDLGLTPYAAKLLAEGLARSHGAVREQAQRWLEDGTVPAMEVDGISIESAIRRGWSSDPVNALLLMDGLRRDPVRTRRILARGDCGVRGRLGGSRRSGTSER
jgi:hypothetical protein